MAQSVHGSHVFAQCSQVRDVTRPWISRCAHRDKRVEPSDLESRGLRIEIQRVVSSVIGSRNLRTEIRRVGRIMELALCS